MKADSRRAAIPDTTDDVPMNTWRQLYELAARVGSLEPWCWMYEADLFGVQEPQSGQVWFVSVMGHRGQYRAVALYAGAEGLDRFWHAHNSEEGDNGPSVDLGMGTYQLHMAFEPKSELEAQDKRLLKELGLKFKVGGLWPLPRSHRPGYHPWFLDTTEAVLLASALEQLLQVAARAREDESLLSRKTVGEKYLVRVPVGRDPSSVYVDERREFTSPPDTIRISVPSALINEIRSMETSGMSVDVDFFPLAVRIGKKGERCLRPSLLMLVEPKSGIVLAADSLTAKPSWEDMWGSVPARFLAAIKPLGARPGRLAVRSVRLFGVLKPLCDELGIRLTCVRQLNALDKAREGLERFGAF